MNIEEMDLTDIIELSELGLLLVDPDTGEESWLDLFHDDINQFLESQESN